MARLWPMVGHNRVGASRDALRQVMRRWATGVTVVTVCSGDEVRGVTVNSFTSVSLDPPMVLICLDRRARTHHLILAWRRFCINVLAQEQYALSDRFAGRGSGDQGRLDDCCAAVTPGGLPILTDCLAWFDCQLSDTLAVGDHTVFIGLVTHAEVAAAGRPLVFFGGGYRQLPEPTT